MLSISETPVAPDGYPADVVRALGASPLLGMDEVCRRAAVSPSHVYAMRACFLFPQFVQLSSGCSRLPALLLDAWLWTRVRARDRSPRRLTRVALAPWRPAAVELAPVVDIEMWRLEAVVERVRMGTSTIYRQIRADLFPEPVPITAVARRWARHEVEAWLAGRVARSACADRARVRGAFPRFRSVVDRSG